MSNTISQQPNWTLIKHLAAKDWYLNRLPLMAYLVLGLIAVALLSIPGMTGFYMGAVLLISSVSIAGIHLTVATILQERKNQNLPFVMSLPISYLDYTLAKMLLNIGVFLVLWLILMLSVVVLTLTLENVRDGIIPFITIALLELLIAFTLLLAVAMVTESEAVTVVFMTIGNICVPLFWHFTASIEAIGAQMQTDQIDWNSTVLTFVVVEAIIILVTIAATFYLQSRKTDFL